MSETTDHPITLTDYVDKLKEAYKTTPTTWLSLPNCKHIKLALTNETATRHSRGPDELIEHSARGEAEPPVASKVPIEVDSIFEEGIIENVHPPLVILVEGVFQSGKSTLAYNYCQKWADGNLGMFELVALVHLRHPAVHFAGAALTLDQLLLLACDYSEKSKESNIAGNIAQRIKEGMKFLLILDGWNDAPVGLRAPPDPKHPTDNSFLGKLFRSVSSNTTILITSRPESSIDLHNRPNVKRMEILGFTKESIHDYVREALSTQLSSTILDDECRKIKDHLVNYPAIENQCYIPLNAAILMLLYLQPNRILPTTQFEMFRELILHYINTCLRKRSLGTVSSLDTLPRNLKKRLKYISILAYKGLMSNKIVFTQDELLFILPVSSRDSILNYLSQTATEPAQKNLPAMGLLQIVQWTENKFKTVSYNFVNHSIQEMLAAYHISQMRNDKQARVFRTLLCEPQYATVLQFYAAFTKLTNRGVSEVIRASDFTSATLLSYIRCCFEAQIYNQSLYEKLFRKMNSKLCLANVTFCPLVCMSVGYFLAFVLREGRKLKVDIYHCGIDDRLFSLMMKELSKHAHACPAGVLCGMTELNISSNKIGDASIALIASALQTNTTTTKLNISGCNVSDDGAESLARALSVNSSLQMLYVINNDIGDIGIGHIATACQTNTSLRALTIGGETATDEGVLSLATALTANSSMESFGLSWSSTHPGSTLKNIGECVSKTTVSKLHLEMNMPASGEAPVTEERAKEWLQSVEVGGKVLIKSLEDGYLEDLYLVLNYHTMRLFFKNNHSQRLDKLREALEATTATVNTFRREIKLPKLCLLFYSY